MFIIKGFFILVVIAIALMALAPIIMKVMVKKMVGKMTRNQQQFYNGSNSQSSNSSENEQEDAYHGSVLVHDEESARRMRRMKADAEDVEAVIIDEPAKVREEEKVYR